MPGLSTTQRTGLPTLVPKPAPALLPRQESDFKGKWTGDGECSDNGDCIGNADDKKHTQTNLTYHQKRYNDMRDRGICTKCATRPARDDGVFCHECTQTHKPMEGICLLVSRPVRDPIGGVVDNNVLVGPRWEALSH